MWPIYLVAMQFTDWMKTHVFIPKFLMESKLMTYVLTVLVAEVIWWEQPLGPCCSLRMAFEAESGIK